MTSTPELNTLPAGRHAGVCLHISSLPGPYGIGEIGSEARAFVDKMRDMQLSVWQFLPTGPTAYGDSPYQPLSTFAGNEMLISIGDLVESGFLAENEVEELTALPTHFVDYGPLIPVKSRLLEIAAQRFTFKASPELKDQYARFLAAHDGAWLHDYAVFRILKTHHAERAWLEWKPEYVHREESALMSPRKERRRANRVDENYSVSFSLPMAEISRLRSRQRCDSVW